MGNVAQYRMGYRHWSDGSRRFGHSRSLVSGMEIPKKYRDVVLLRIYAELPFSQIALALKISENSAKVIFFRAKKKMMEVLKDEFAV